MGVPGVETPGTVWEQVMVMTPRNWEKLGTGF